MPTDTTLYDSFCNYKMASINKDTAAIMELLYSKLFDIYPRQVVAHAQNARHKERTEKVQIRDLCIDEIVFHYKLKGVEYTILHVSCDETIVFPGTRKKAKTDEAYDMSDPEFSFECLTELYGADNVQYDASL
jgi:hypothetical protein